MQPLRTSLTVDRNYELYSETIAEELPNQVNQVAISIFQNDGFSPTPNSILDYLHLPGKSIAFEAWMKIDAIQQKAIDLKKLMPKLSHVDLTMMSAFIELNATTLFAELKYWTSGIYLRREITRLPLSLTIIPTGHFFWEMKKKVRDELPMKGGFKKLYKCVEHAEAKIYLSGSMPLANKKDMMITEFTAGKTFQGIAYTSQTIYMGIYQGKKTKSDTDLSLQHKLKIIMEYYPEGDLRSLIVSNDSRLKLNKIPIVDALLHGIYNIHTAGWIHGDLKPTNIFFDGRFRPVLGDFGCTHQKSEIPSIGCINYYHPHYYNLSSQHLLKSHPKLEIIQQQQDMYAMGISLAQMELKSPVSFSTPKIISKILDSTISQPEKFKWISECLRRNLSVCSRLTENTVTQKLIKVLVQPNLDSIPTSSEAIVIWNRLVQAHSI